MASLPVNYFAYCILFAHWDQLWVHFFIIMKLNKLHLNKHCLMQNIEKLKKKLTNIENHHRNIVTVSPGCIPRVTTWDLDQCIVASFRYQELSPTHSHSAGFCFGLPLVERPLLGTGINKALIIPML